MIRVATHMVRALHAELQTYGARLFVADALHGLADRVHPQSAAWRDEHIEVLREVGWWVYGGSGWTSPRTMLKAALDRAQHDKTWMGAMS